MGCGWQQPKQESRWQKNESTTAIDLPAARLVQVAQQAVAAPPLSLGVQDEKDGSILTGWKEYPGDVHIVRRWYERTRFRINVIPDFSDPAGKSHLWVEDQTEERATDRQPWYPAPQTHRPERAEEVARQIVEYVQRQGKE